MAPMNEDVRGTNCRVSEGMTEKKSTSMNLTDPDVLDCPICFNPLTIPVFQCENGHIACACCSTNISNCPSCACPIGNNRCRALEKVLESVEVPCPNASYGCNASLSYSKLSRHEALCIYTPCSCPMRACNFLEFSNDLYTHFTRTHNSAKPIEFYSPKPISLKKNQRFLYLRDKIEGTIFVVNHHFCSFGSAVNVICVAPGSSARRFPYQLVVKGGETSIKLESVAENIPNWDPNKPLKTFLMVPMSDITDSCDQIRLEVCIKNW
ncbi:PREDICTED: E3 ubiquitin-protein ligase SINA-like 7 [Ipomoea nil]|uniref:E3 ubiquitin-protein ligase SINA-like 7 n=1 Tax=Ipomoea nil TaxID=35883 RepID=UPI000900EA45|nr:PREDICTED: E3 ubiquitin-protein ligase SINA-like 7 [Ipomoea nil]